MSMRAGDQGLVSRPDQFWSCARCAMEYAPRPPLWDSDHEIVLVSAEPGEASGESNSFDEIRKGEQ